ncbi:MAG: patatin family protein [Eubacteriales bacterium]|nr:patatin family protein [Eubacteriales bacterium]
MVYQAGLVLEGGAMKGVYTAGVLDFFLDEGIDFAKAYGVSAGACCLCSYLSGQRGRAYAVMTDYLDDRNYWGLSSLVRTGDFFNAQMCYYDIPERLNPFDYEAFEKNPCRGYAVVTNIRTGLAEYLPMRDMRRDIEAVRASASMPLVSRNVEIGGQLYLDGGLADSIPLLHAVTDGCRKNVVVMTKEEGYRRLPARHLEVIRARYARYPKVYELMKNRHIEYNRTLDYMEEQVKNGRALVLRPRHAGGVGRVEKDREKLRAFYEEGYAEAAARRDELLAFLRD